MVADNFLRDIFGNIIGIDAVDAPGESSVQDGFLTLTATTTDDYVIVVTLTTLLDPLGKDGINRSYTQDDYVTDYVLTVRPANAVPNDIIQLDLHRDNGDENRFRDQGQLVIDSVTIRDTSGPVSMLLLIPRTWLRCRRWLATCHVQVLRVSCGT